MLRMTLCCCCYCSIREPVIATIAGSMSPGLGLCRGCWRQVPAAIRAAVRRARLEFRLAPHLREGLALYGVWDCALAAARANRQRRAA